MTYLEEEEETKRVQIKSYKINNIIIITHTYIYIYIEGRENRKR